MGLISTCTATPEIRVKQKEAKTVTFTITENEVAVDVSTAILTFEVEDRDDNSTIISKADGDFDKTQAASGIVSVDLSATDLDQEVDKYRAELKIFFSSTSIDKSADIDFYVDYAITD